MLEKIQKPNDIKKIPADQLPALAEEIREFIIESLSKTGGHLASNLGVVELTIAMHRVFDLPKDKLIWDVGHQSYTHKILTGRKDGFETLRREGGISGFPKRSESDYDVFDTGHSSTSISAGVGYVRARELKKENYSVVSIIGDGALTGGMAYEALNNAASLKSNFIIVLNDNEMSITENVGGMSSYLSGLRTASAYTDFKMDVTKALNRIPGIGPGMVDAMRKTKSSIKQIIIPGMLFEDMGLTYLGPVDGHNIPHIFPASWCQNALGRQKRCPRWRLHSFPSWRWSRSSRQRRGPAAAPAPGKVIFSWRCSFQIAYNIIQITAAFCKSRSAVFTPRSNTGESREWEL